MTARVLALDLSLTATGICTPDGHGVVEPVTTGERRLCEIRDRVLDHAASEYTDLPPDLVVMEDCLVRTPASAVLGMLHGAIRAAFIDHDIPYLVVSPATLKVYATGNGRSGKPDMRVELFKRTGLDVRDDNQVDARWLWYLAHDLLGEPVLDLPNPKPIAAPSTNSTYPKESFMLLSELLADHPLLDREIGQSLDELCEKVVAIDRKARLGVEIGIEKKGQRVLLSIAHTEKPPKPDPEAGLYYPGPNGLCKDDPWQTSLDDIDPETGEIRPKEQSK